MELKKITHSIVFWIVIAFIAGFGVNELTTRLHVNPMRSEAFMDASQSGAPKTCDTWSGDTINCWHNSLIQQYYESYSGGGTGYYSEYDQIRGLPQQDEYCAWFPTLAMCSNSSQTNSSTDSHQSNTNAGSTPTPTPNPNTNVFGPSQTVIDNYQRQNGHPCGNWSSPNPGQVGYVCADQPGSQGQVNQSQNQSSPSGGSIIRRFLNIF